MKVSQTLAIALISMLHFVTDAQAQTSLETAISHLEYRGIGPALMGGRISDLEVVATKPQTVSYTHLRAHET